jgi:hypothetical protein
MPAWMTSLLRELVSVPTAGCRSMSRTELPGRLVSWRATAMPTTPAPMT